MDANTSRKRRSSRPHQDGKFRHYDSFALREPLRRVPVPKKFRPGSANQNQFDAPTPQVFTPLSDAGTLVDEAETGEEDEVEEICRPELVKAKRPMSFLDFEIVSPIVGHIGSFRGDPFKMYPVETTPVVTQAIDYFSENYGPVAIRLPGDKTTEKLTPFFATYFRTMLHDPMLFELIVALSLAMQRLHLGATARLTPDILRHLRNVLVHLHHRLPTSEGTADVVILTIIGTMFVNYLTRDFRSFKIHLDGLRRIVELRGGKDKLGWNGYLRDRATQVEDIWAATSKEQLDQVNDSQSSLPATMDLHYPSHPFSPGLCKQISGLPPGFRELALTTKISVELVDVLEQLVTFWKHRAGEQGAQFASGYLPANKILDAPKITTVERLIAVASLALCNYIDQNMFGHTFPLHHMREQAQIEVLAVDRAIKTCNKDCLEWAAHVLRSTTPPRSETHQWAQKVLQLTVLSERRKKQLEALFFAIPHQSKPEIKIWPAATPWSVG